MISKLLTTFVFLCVGAATAATYNTRDIISNRANFKAYPMSQKIRRMKLTYAAETSNRDMGIQRACGETFTRQLESYTRSTDLENLYNTNSEILISTLQSATVLNEKINGGIEITRFEDIAVISNFLQLYDMAAFVVNAVYEDPQLVFLAAIRAELIQFCSTSRNRNIDDQLRQRVARSHEIAIKEMETLARELENIKSQLEELLEKTPDSAPVPTPAKPLAPSYSA